MSSAFDTIDRELLLNILEQILGEDELRLIRFLLSDTHISLKVKGATIKQPFLSNVGTPQGDSLSPVLFILYLEAALREIRDLHDREDLIPSEVAYADDVDFISMVQHKDINQVQQVLGKYNLLVNNDKTEYTNIKREAKTEDETWRKVKKVGSLLGDEEDIDRRKTLSTLAMNKMLAIWIRKDKINQARRIHLYRALVRSILLYNCGTWAVTKDAEQKLDAFHRKQLKRVLGIKYPTVISNTELYKKTGEQPISSIMRKSRWELFGHIMRRDRQIPAYMAMELYFDTNSNGKGFRGKRRTTLPIKLQEDLDKTHNVTEVQTDHNYHKRIKLNNKADLEHLRSIAQDRKDWRTLTTRIRKAGEAGTPVDGPAKRP